MRPQQRGGGARRLRLTAAGVSAALVGALCVVGGTTQVVASASTAAERSRCHGGQGNKCHLGNGIKHVVQIGFDNVHFFRDNPNVPSDLQLMPNLLNFFEANGTFLSNSHTPLIAHTADDLLTTATGLYGDRQGDGISNSYQAYNADGTTDPADGVHLLERPDRRHGQDTERGPRHQPQHGLLAGAAGHGLARRCRRPLSRRRRGCPTPRPAAMSARSPRPTRSLRTRTFDIPKVFGANSPEAQQTAADTDSFKDNETADYVGLGVHCAQGAAFCADAQAVKFGQTTPSHDSRGGPAAGRAGRLQRLPGAVRIPVHRAAARRRHCRA